jgi:DNA-binding transcriptional LysR family regulator
VNRASTAPRSTRRRRRHASRRASARLGQEASRITSALSLVATGLGIAIVPASVQSVAMDGVAYRRLAGAAQPKAFLGLASRRGDPSPLVRHFVTMVGRAARTLCPSR